MIILTYEKYLAFITFFEIKLNNFRILQYLLLPECSLRQLLDDDMHETYFSVC